MKLAIACARLLSVGARFIAPLVPVEERFANWYEGVINVTPTGRAARFAAALTRIPPDLFPVYFGNVHYITPMGRASLLRLGRENV